MCVCAAHPLPVYTSACLSVHLACRAVSYNFLGLYSAAIEDYTFALSKEESLFQLDERTSERRRKRMLGTENIDPPSLPPSLNRLAVFHAVILCFRYYFSSALITSLPHCPLWNFSVLVLYRIFITVSYLPRRFL